MMIERIRELRYARPFKPFAIHLRDGRQLKVRRWDAFAISPTGQRIVVVEPGYQSIEIDSISDLTPVSARSGKRRSNGHDH